MELRGLEGRDAEGATWGLTPSQTPPIARTPALGVSFPVFCTSSLDASQSRPGRLPRPHLLSPWAEPSPGAGSLAERRHWAGQAFQPHLPQPERWHRDLLCMGGDVKAQRGQMVSEGHTARRRHSKDGGRFPP